MYSIEIENAPGFSLWISVHGIGRFLFSHDRPSAFGMTYFLEQASIPREMYGEHGPVFEEIANALARLGHPTVVVVDDREYRSSETSSRPII